MPKKEIPADLKAIYDRIPKFSCMSERPGCSDCCGPVFFSEVEWDLIEDKKHAASLNCPYSTTNGCSIYDHRPYLCRIMGIFEDLQCPHRIKPVFQRLLTAEEGRALTLEYFEKFYDRKG